MTLSREAKLISGTTLLTVPTVMYGGMALLGILTQGIVGLAPGELVLDETQWALWRAGHAHAGVWLILSLVNSGANRCNEVVASDDVAGSYQRTCSSGCHLGRLFWRCLRFCILLASIFRSFKPSGCLNTHRCRITAESTHAYLTSHECNVPAVRRKNARRRTGKDNPSLF
jgi:hypothetical protein